MPPTAVNHADDAIPTHDEMMDVVNDEFDGLADGTNGTVVENDTGSANDESVRIGGEGQREEADELFDDDELEQIDGQPQGAQGDRQRDEQGRFVSQETKDATAKAGTPDPAAQGKTAPAATGTAPAAGAAPTTDATKVEWKPLGVMVDRAVVPIANASVTNLAGHKIISIKDDNWNAFQSQITKGVVAERIWRDLNHNVAEFERRKKLDAEMPKEISDDEIEAKEIIQYLKETGRLAEMFTDERDKELLERRVENAKLVYRNTTYPKQKADFLAAREADEAKQMTPEKEADEQVKGIGQVMEQIKAALPQEFGHITKDAPVTKAIAAAVWNVRRAAYYRDASGKWTADTGLIHSIMKDVAARFRDTGAGTPSTPAATGTTGASPASGTTPSATSSHSSTDQRNARLNRAELQTGRSTARPRAADPGTTGTTGQRAKAQPVTRHEKALAAEDRYRNAQRAYLNNPGLDFELPDDIES